MPDVNLHVYASAADAARACALRAAALLTKRLSEAESVTLAISGGSTPALMFRELAACPVEWRRVHLFQVDERRVPPDDARSNYRLALTELITPAGIPPENVHRIHGELAAEEAAVRYVAEIRHFFGTPPGVVPVFDIVHRGMGGEAHTASLFPGQWLIGDATGIAEVVTVPAVPRERVTLLPGPLAAARHTLMLTAGGDKAEALHRVLTHKYEPFQMPAQIGTFGSARAEWYVDSAAAALMPRS
jgi:6-phosphogluconolactonase